MSLETVSGSWADAKVSINSSKTDPTCAAGAEDDARARSAILKAESSLLSLLESLSLLEVGRCGGMAGLAGSCYVLDPRERSRNGALPIAPRLPPGPRRRRAPPRPRTEATRALHSPYAWSGGAPHPTPAPRACLGRATRHRVSCACAAAGLEVGFSQDLRSSAQNAPGRGQLCTAAPLPQQCRPRTAEPPRVRLVHCCRSCAPHALSWRLAVHCAHSCGSSARGGQLRQPAVHWQHRRGSSCALAALL